MSLRFLHYWRAEQSSCWKFRAERSVLKIHQPKITNPWSIIILLSTMIHIFSNSVSKYQTFFIFHYQIENTRKKAPNWENTYIQTQNLSKKGQIQIRMYNTTQTHIHKYLLWKKKINKHKYVRNRRMNQKNI
jgi:hypothetical protein